MMNDDRLTKKDIFLAVLGPIVVVAATKLIEHISDHFKKEKEEENDERKEKI